MHAREFHRLVHHVEEEVEENPDGEAGQESPPCLIQRRQGEARHGDAEVSGQEAGDAAHGE